MALKIVKNLTENITDDSISLHGEKWTWKENQIWNVIKNTKHRSGISDLPGGP